jgi:hypothetical protein
MGHGLQDAKASNPADSYFWYAVDTITITFPHFVSETDSCHGIRSVYVADPDTVDCTGHVHDIIVDENIEVDAANGSPTARLSASITEGCTSNYGPGATVNYQCAPFCKNGEITCGKTLTITNIMSTFDSTVQSRKSGLSSSTPTPKLLIPTLPPLLRHQLVSSRPCPMCSSQLPVSPISFARFFNKRNSEVNSIVLACDSSSSEKCKGYTRAQNMPYAGDATEGNRWTNDDTVISNGDARGDAFWVNNNDN